MNEFNFSSKLIDIIKKKKEIIEYKKKVLPIELIFSKLENTKIENRDFKKAIKRKQNRLSIIAECKKASPSKGILRQNYNVEEIVSIYTSCDLVDAVSVLTEENFFLGDIYHLVQAKTHTDLPVLRKDFIIDEYQIYESAYYCADAVLLISTILEEEKLSNFYQIAKNLNLDVLFEVHTEEDIKKVLKLEPQIVGINNRNLKTFEVDIKTTEKLVEHLPKNIVIVSESGIFSKNDIKYLSEIGVDAVLIGTYFMQQQDIKQAIEDLFRN